MCALNKIRFNLVRLVVFAFVIIGLTSVPHAPVFTDASAGYAYGGDRKGFSGFKKFSNKAKSATKSFSNRAKSKAKSFSNRAKSKTKSFSNRAKSATKNYGNRAKSAVRDYGSRAKGAAKNYGNSAKSKMRDFGNNAKRYGNSAVNRTKSAAQRAAERTNAERRRVMAGMPKGVSMNTVKSLGSGARDKVKRMTSSYGDRAGAATANFLKRRQSDGGKILDQSRGLIEKTVRHTKDPATRERVVTGILVASATGYALYKHQDDLKYVALKKALSVPIPVNGEMKSGADLWSDAIKEKYPMLANTDIANDPAKTVAFGLGSTARGDLVNHLPIMPDGRGGKMTLRETGQSVGVTEDKLAVLQLQASMEDATMEAMNDGRLGSKAEIFAASYYDVESRIEASAAQ